MVLSKLQGIWQRIIIIIIIIIIITFVYSLSADFMEQSAC